MPIVTRSVIRVGPDQALKDADFSGRPARAGLVERDEACERCGAPMVRVHACWRCERCGWKADCGPGPGG